MRQGEWKYITESSVEAREDPLHICSMFIRRSPGINGYELRAVHEEFFRYSEDLESLKMLADKTYHHRTESYLGVLRARVQNTNKEIELATQLLG